MVELKQVDTTLREQYYSALNGSVTVSGDTLKVYNKVPPDASPPYIRIGSDTGSEMIDKDAFGWNLTQRVSVVYRFQGKEGGEKLGETAKNQIMKIIRKDPNNILDLGSDWNHIITRLEAQNKIEQQTSDGYVIKHVMTFRHVIEQL